MINTGNKIKYPLSMRTHLSEFFYDSCTGIGQLVPDHSLSGQIAGQTLPFKWFLKNHWNMKINPYFQMIGLARYSTSWIFYTLKTAFFFSFWVLTCCRFIMDIGWNRRWEAFHIIISWDAVRWFPRELKRKRTAFHFAHVMTSAADHGCQTDIKTCT